MDVGTPDWLRTWCHSSLVRLPSPFLSALLKYFLTLKLCFKKLRFTEKNMPQSVSSALPSLLLHLSAEIWTCFDFTLCWLERKTRSGSGAQLMGGVRLVSESVGQREAGLGGTIHTLEAGSKSQAQIQTHWLVCVVKLFTRLVVSGHLTFELILQSIFIILIK